MPSANGTIAVEWGGWWCHIDGLLSFLFFRFGTLYNMPRFIDRTIPLRKWIYLAHSPLDLCFPLCAVLTMQTHTHTQLTPHEYRRFQYGCQRIGISNQQSIYSYPSAHTTGFDIGLSDANTENWKNRKNYTPMHRAQNPCSMLDSVLDLSVCSCNQYARNRTYTFHLVWIPIESVDDDYGICYGRKFDFLFATLLDFRLVWQFHPFREKCLFVVTHTKDKWRWWWRRTIVGWCSRRIDEIALCICLWWYRLHNAARVGYSLFANRMCAIWCVYIPIASLVLRNAQIQFKFKVYADIT